jgi:hypothetical protein
MFMQFPFVRPSEVRISPTLRSFSFEGSPREAKSSLIAVVSALSLQTAADG